MLTHPIDLPPILKLAFTLAFVVACLWPALALADLRARFHAIEDGEDQGADDLSFHAAPDITEGQRDHG